MHNHAVTDGRMKVERKKFLRLVAAIAGSSAACGTKPEPQSAIMVPVETPDASAALVTGPSPPPRSEPTPRERENEEEATVTAATSSAPGGIWSLAYDPSAKAKSCADLKCPGPTQEGMSALRNACRTIEKRLATEPFQRFMACMMGYNNTLNTCDLMKVGESPGECLHGWYDTPKIDPGATAKCKSIVATCAGPKRSVHASKPITMDECEKVLTVTNPKSEAKMIHCTVEYCGEALRLCHGGYG
jgi:hypothetical protein